MSVSVKKNVFTGIRLLVGLAFVVFGLNGFFQFIPLPPPTPEGGAFLGALFKTGYFFPFLKSLEIVAGLALLANRFVPLAIVVLAPINVNIFLYHVFLDGVASLPMPIFLLGTNLILAWAYRDNLAGLFVSKAETNVGTQTGSAQRI